MSRGAGGTCREPWEHEVGRACRRESPTDLPAKREYKGRGLEQGRVQGKGPGNQTLGCVCVLGGVRAAEEKEGSRQQGLLRCGEKGQSVGR